MSNVITVEQLWSQRDKYGRNVWQNYAIKGVAVTMPKTYRNMHPGQNYLVNLRDNANGIGQSTIVYFEKLADAKRYLVENSAPTRVMQPPLEDELPRDESDTTPV